MAPGLKMITDENRIEAPLFGENRVVEQFTGPELLRRRLVAQSQQHASPFAISRPWSTRTARLRTGCGAPVSHVPRREYHRAWCADVPGGRCGGPVPEAARH